MAVVAAFCRRKARSVPRRRTSPSGRSRAAARELWRRRTPSPQPRRRVPCTTAHSTLRVLAFPNSPHEAMLFSNIDDGYLEGLLRGYRAGILTSTDYQNLSQCETIDGAPRAKLRNSRPYSRGGRHARAIALCGPAAAGPLVSSAPFPLCGPALSPPRAPFPPQT